MEFLRRLGRGLSRQPYLLLPLAIAMWGGNTIAGRLAVGEASPMAVVCLRWLIVVAVLAPFLRRVPAGDLAALRSRWPALLAWGGLGFTLFNALFYWSAHHTSAVNMGLIQGITPAIVLVGSFLVYRTPIRLLQVLGVAAAFVGVAVAAARGDLAVLRDLDLNVGDLGIAAASLLYGGYTVALRSRPAVAPLAFFSALAAAALLTSLPLLAWEMAVGEALWPTPKGWLIILYVALFPSLISQLLYMRGVELMGPGRAALFMNLIPIFSALGAVALLGETFAPYHAVAFACVLGGIYLAERRPAAA